MNKAAEGLEEYWQRTWIPETVKYGISNLTRMGALLSGTASSEVILGRPKSARNKYSYKINLTKK